MIIDHVDDSIVLEKIASLYKDGGRPPIDPRVCFRMHYLYFTRLEISSFRELVRQLKKPKNQAWRNFIGVPNIEKVSVHSYLSNFRAKANADLFHAILFDLIAQALKLKDFLLPTLTGIDSRPIWANVKGFRHKRCFCPDQKKCACEKTYSDPDATCGVQRTKANQNKFFIGYCKNSIVCPSPKGPIVLFSIILLNDRRSEGNAPQAQCDQGHSLVFDGFDKATYTAWFHGDEEKCAACPLQVLCEKQFGYSFTENPFFYGPVPQDSILQKYMLNFIN